jgi:hypothetical protein
MTARVLSPEAQRLDLLAATQIIADADVTHCWELIRHGIQSNKIGAGNLDRLLSLLRAGGGMGVDELTIEIEPTGSDRLLVGELDDERWCSAPKMIDELERLAVRAGLRGPASPASPSSSAPGSSGPSSSGGASGASGASAGGAPDLLGLLAGLLGTTPDRLAGDPAAYHAHVERIRAAAQQWRDAIADPHSDPAARSTAEAELRALLSATGEQAAAGATMRAADLERTVQALGIDPGRIAGALRTIAEWLEQRTPAAGAAVDRMIAALDAAAAPFLGHPTPAAAEAERDQRIRDSARAAIAAHLKLPRDPS